jgi:hypothetical protein
MRLKSVNIQGYRLFRNNDNDKAGDAKNQAFKPFVQFLENL